MSFSFAPHRMNAHIVLQARRGELDANRLSPLQVEMYHGLSCDDLKALASLGVVEKEA